MADLDPVKGLIELTDNFTSEIGLAEAALSNFTKTNQESLKATAEAAALVTGAIVAIGAAAIELGKRGAEVNEVNENLVKFAGGAKQAADDMAQLKQATLGTVDNFSLAKDAVHLLSTGVKLSAEDFGTLGKAAMEMKSRGLGPAKDNLDLISDALVSGRTRALAMKLGVADITNAHEEFAKSIGVAVGNLNEAGKAEANRIAVMKLLQSVTKDTGVQTRNFADEFKYAQSQISNWVDDLGSAIASSKVFTAGFKAVEDALGKAFSGDSELGIKNIVHFLEQGAITLVNFGQATISAARVMEGAWNSIKTIILGVLTAAAGVADGLVETLTVVAQAGNKLKIIPDDTVVYLKDTRTELRAMTKDLASQTAEAAKAVFGHTEFDKTLDSMSAGLSSVEQAMVKASQATGEDTKALGEASKASGAHTDATKKLADAFINREKVQQELEKSIKELQALDDQYFAEVKKNSGTSFDQAKADIIAWRDAQVAALNTLDPLYQKKFDDIYRIANEKLKGISSDWNSVRDTSLEALQQQRDKAWNTYEDMLFSADHFSREALDTQLKKYRDLQDAVRNYGHEATAATTSVISNVRILNSAWEATNEQIDDANVKVKLLDGEVVSVAEALKRLNIGGSSDVTSQNFEQALMNVITSGGWNPSGQGSNIDIAKAYKFAKEGYSFAEIIAIFARMKNGATGPLPPPQGPRIPGFKEGGIVMVGEAGPEAVRLPFGSQVYPTGTPAPMMGGGGGNIHLGPWYVNGTAVQAAQQIKDIILRELQLRRQF